MIVSIVPKLAKVAHTGKQVAINGNSETGGGCCGEKS
jgi:hypothetical protein